MAVATAIACRICERYGAFVMNQKCIEIQPSSPGGTNVTNTVENSSVDSFLWCLVVFSEPLSATAFDELTIHHGSDVPFTTTVF